MAPDELAEIIGAEIDKRMATPGAMGLRGLLAQLAQATALTVLCAFLFWIYRDLSAKSESDQMYMRQLFERTQVASSEERVRLWESNTRQHKALNDDLQKLALEVRAAMEKLSK